MLQCLSRVSLSLSLSLSLSQNHLTYSVTLIIYTYMSFHTNYVLLSFIMIGHFADILKYPNSFLDIRYDSRIKSCLWIKVQFSYFQHTCKMFTHLIRSNLTRIYMYIYIFKESLKFDKLSGGIHFKLYWSRNLSLLQLIMLLALMKALI